MNVATAIADSAQQSVAGQKRTANVEQATGLLSNLIGETSVTQRWVVSTTVLLKLCVTHTLAECVLSAEHGRSRREEKSRISNT